MHGLASQGYLFEAGGYCTLVFANAKTAEADAFAMRECLDVPVENQLGARLSFFTNLVKRGESILRIDGSGKTGCHAWNAGRNQIVSSRQI